MEKLNLATEIEELNKVVHELREKCPWDKKQTWESLRKLTIEELYELIDAIDNKENTPELIKELGDVLLHVMFYSMIAEEETRFDLALVCKSLREKLIYRHPHIYGNIEANTEEEVLKNWEELKLKEGNKSVMSGISKAAPPMNKALRIQEKAASVGFDWDNKKDVIDKVKEELNEFLIECDNNNTQNQEKEFGDLLFSLVNLSRFLNLEPDKALEGTNQKFMSRFKYIENKALLTNSKLSDLSLEQMDYFWNLAKKEENGSTY